MKNYVTYLFVWIALLASGCSVDTKGIAPAPGKSGTNSVGPFSIDMPTDGTSRSHQFEVNVLQVAGSVQYFVNAAEDMTLELVDATTTVTDCDASEVETEVLWFPYGSLSNFSYYVPKNGSFDLLKSEKGYLLVQFRNIGECTKLKYKMTLQKF